MFENIKNGTVRHEAIQTFFYFRDDAETRAAVKKVAPKLPYEPIVEGAVEYCFYCPGQPDCFNPYLDKEYLDCSWLRVGKKIINLDDIYDVIINNAEELAKEMEDGV